MEEKIVLERADTSLRKEFRGRDLFQVLREVQDHLKSFEEDIKAGRFISAGILGYSPSTGTHTFTLRYSRLPR